MIRRMILQPITKTLMKRGKPDQNIFQTKKNITIQSSKYFKITKFSNLFYIHI
jgi:hypothetical protein